jgi:transketolase
MRTALIKQLIEEAKTNPRLFLLVGDLGYSVVEPFAREFPDRFLNVGVAEQNMTGIAAGLAFEGYNVFTYSIANFPTLRAMEHVRYDVAYHKANVKVVSVGGGYAYGSLGASHHATEDIGMLRTIPDMTVVAPGDPLETRQITAALCNFEGPAYLRLGKAGEPAVHPESTLLEWGRFVPVKRGSGTAILSTGAVLKYAVDFVAEHQLDWSIFSVPFVKPLDSEGLLAIARSHPMLVTVEEHQRSAGFGSAVLEALHDLQEHDALTSLPAVRRLAIPDTFLNVAGTQEYLRKLAGIELDKIR